MIDCDFVLLSHQTRGAINIDLPLRPSLFQNAYKNSESTDVRKNQLFPIDQMILSEISIYWDVT